MRYSKFQVWTSAGKVVASFWESQGILLVGFLERGVSVEKKLSGR
jgi:hypothetical protein